MSTNISSYSELPKGGTNISSGGKVKSNDIILPAKNSYYVRVHALVSISQEFGESDTSAEGCG